jgi:hypothetical protein
VADVPSGLSLTPPQETKKKLTKCSRDIFVVDDVVMSRVPVASVWTTGTKIGLNNNIFGVTTLAVYVTL